MEINKRLEELEKYQNRIVASINELNTNIKELQDCMNKLEDENEKFRELLNTNDTNIIIKQAKREPKLKKITEAIEKIEVRPNCTGDRSEKIDIALPVFFGNQRDLYPKKILAKLEKYLAFKKNQWRRPNDYYGELTKKQSRVMVPYNEVRFTQL